jgi:hypothetical protein
MRLLAMVAGDRSAGGPIGAPARETAIRSLIFPADARAKPLPRKAAGSPAPAGAMEPERRTE